MAATNFPNGRRAALSLTFDDARPSQIDGMKVLDRHGIHATFYVSPQAVEQRLEAWRGAAASGHEIGNHTMTHPCSGNFPFARWNALEAYSLERIEEEIVGANEFIERALGVKPESFAYPCGHTFVGRGAAQRSYVPVVARHFLAGRWAVNECFASPLVCDLAQLPALELDGKSFAHARAMIKAAVAEGAWLIFYGHEIASRDARHTVRSSVLEKLCRHCREIEGDLWTAPVAEVARHIRSSRNMES